MKEKVKAFTLLEIMIVVAILGILLAIAIPNFLKARRKSFIRTAQASLKQIDGARAQFLIDCTGTVALVDTIEEIEAELVPNYVKVWPRCPGNGFFIADSTNIYARIPGYNNDNRFTAYDAVTP